MKPAFPSGFLWGAATAAYQVEGAAAEDGRSPSIWDVFCHTPGNTLCGDTGDTACDHYHRFPEDVELMRTLGLGAYRFSVSWSRVMPSGTEPINSAGLGFYDKLVDCLCEAGIEPFVTLYHWDLPNALQASSGGWLHADLPRRFADYANVVFDRLGDRVRFWLTINEPWCIVDGGYFTAQHAPGIEDPALGYVAGHNLMRGHAYAVAAYRASRHGTGAISFALNSNFAYPVSDSAAGQAAADRAVEGFAGWFGDPAYRGEYPSVMRARLGNLLPEFSEEDRELLRGSMDYLAVNYYTSDFVRHAVGAGPMEYERIPQPDRLHTETGWAVVPDGLRDLLLWLTKRYPELPVYITENGAAFADTATDDGEVDDQARIAYLRAHLDAASRARAGGVDLRGYFAWSLLDNLEWSHGFSKRFGLIRCDFETLERTIKASGHWYADVIRNARSQNHGIEAGTEQPVRGGVSG
ncbi:MAG: beta-glucosidase [bacterium]|nr:beta-glucosidase [bacterium]